jgi:hypothetical protein
MLELEEAISKLKIIHVAGTKGKVIFIELQLRLRFASKVKPCWKFVNVLVKFAKTSNLLLLKINLMYFHWTSFSYCFEKKAKSCWKFVNVLVKFAKTLKLLLLKINMMYRFKLFIIIDWCGWLIVCNLLGSVVALYFRFRVFLLMHP